MNGFTGQIMLFAGYKLPTEKGKWLPCSGQELPIQTYPALYGIIGNTFGFAKPGNFVLPNLNGRTVKHKTSFPYEKLENLYGGREMSELLPNNLPSHTHIAKATSVSGNINLAKGNWLAHTGSGDDDYASSGNSVEMGVGTISFEGKGEAINIMQPYLGIYYIICVAGIHPFTPPASE